MIVPRFKVDECMNSIVSAVGLVDGDSLVLFRRTCTKRCPGDEGGMVFVEYTPNGCPVVIDSTHNPLFVDVPGEYELRFAGATNPDVRVCIDDYIRNCAHA